MLINLIAAMCHNNGIGFKGKLPWKIKEDLQHFSKLTRGNSNNNAIVVGHTTWTGLNFPDGQSFLGRETFILSSSVKFHKITKDGHLIKTFHDINSLIAFCKLMEYEEVWICGGQNVYKQFLSEDRLDKYKLDKYKLDKYRLDKCYLTYIYKDFECDTFFPEMDFTRWKEVDRRKTYNENNECNVDYVVYEKNIRKL